jgi:BA14K-like protein
MEKRMSRIGILGATALSLSLAIATPALAQQVRGDRLTGPGVKAGASANYGGVRAGGTATAQTNFRGARANIAAPNQANIASPSAASPNIAAPTGGRQFAQREFRQGEFRDRDRGFVRDRGFGAGAGFAAGVAAGSALGYGYGYDPYWYGDDYAYYDGGYDVGYPAVAAPVVAEGAVVAGEDASYCAQRYRSYDPATGTYLGFDGLRHPCP